MVLLRNWNVIDSEWENADVESALPSVHFLLNSWTRGVLQQLDIGLFVPMNLVLAAALSRMWSVFYQAIYDIFFLINLCGGVYSFLINLCGRVYSFLINLCGGMYFFLINLCGGMYFF